MGKIKLRLKKGDKVIVLAGRDKGKRGEILRVLAAENRAVVQGVNQVKRQTKPSPATPGGIVAKEMPIHLSNLAIEDPKDGKPTRVGYKILADGSKVRIAKRSGEVLNG